MIVLFCFSSMVYEILHWTTPNLSLTPSSIFIISIYHGLAEDFFVYLPIITHISSAVHWKQIRFLSYWIVLLIWVFNFPYLLNGEHLPIFCESKENSVCKTIWHSAQLEVLDKQCNSTDLTGRQSYAGVRMIHLKNNFFQLMLYHIPFILLDPHLTWKRANDD